MKRLVIIILCLVFGICLINIDNNITKAENEDKPGVILRYSTTKSKYSLFKATTENELPGEGTTYSVSYNPNDKSLKLNLMDGFTLDFNDQTAISTTDIGSPNQIDKYIINISGTASITCTENDNSNIYGIVSGIDDADNEKTQRELIFEGDGTLNITINVVPKNDRDVFGITNYGKITKNGSSKININISNKNATDSNNEAYYGVIAYNDITINDGELNVVIGGQYIKTLDGIISSEGVGEDPPIHNIYINGGKISVTDSVPTVNGQMKTLLVGDNIIINGETANVAIKGINTATNQNPYLCILANTLKVLYGTIDLEMTKNHAGDAGYLTGAAMCNTNILFNKDYNKTESSANLKEGIYQFAPAAPVLHTFLDSNNKPVIAVKVVCDTPYIPEPEPTPSPSPSKKDESCEKVIGPTWHWNNDKGICEDYGVVGTSTR